MLYVESIKSLKDRKGKIISLLSGKKHSAKSYVPSVFFFALSK